MFLAPFPVISVAEFVLLVRLSAHSFTSDNILISLLSTDVQGELLAFMSMSARLGVKKVEKVSGTWVIHG